MATALKKAYQRAISSAEVSLYTCPTATEAVVNMISLCNYHTSSISVGIEVDHGGAGGTNIKLLTGKSLAQNETYTWDGVLILEVDDVVRVLTSVTSGILDVYASILQIT